MIKVLFHTLILIPCLCFRSSKVALPDAFMVFNDTSTDTLPDLKEFYSKNFLIVVSLIIKSTRDDLERRTITIRNLIRRTSQEKFL